MSLISIEQRAWSNTMVGGLSFLVSMAQTVALVPILLNYWGADNYGLWLTLMAGFSLLQTLDLGHQNFVGNQLNVLYHKDLQQFQRTLGSSLYIAYFLGLVEFCICLLLIASGTLSTFLSIPAEVIIDYQVGLGLLLLMSMWFIFGSVGGILHRMMIPTGMLYQSQWIGIGVRLSQFATIAVVAVSGGAILAVCFWYAVIQSLLSLLILWYIRSYLPQFFPWWKGGRWEDGFRALKKSLVLTCNSIGMQLSNNGLLILISALFSAAVIPSFTTLRTLTNTAGSVTTILITALFPDLIRFHATREVEKLTTVLNVNWLISGIIVNFGIVLVLPLIEPVYRFWTKGYLVFNPSLFFLLAAAISLANFGAGLNLYLNGINDLRAQTVITILRVGVLFSVGYLLSGPFGLLSIGIGVVAAELVASVSLPVLFVNKHLAEMSAQLNHRQLILAILPPFFLLIAGTVISVYHQWMGWVTVVLVPVLCGVYYCNWRGLNPDVRQRIALHINSIGRKFSFGR